MRKYVEELSFGLISPFRPLHHRPMYAQPAARSGDRTNLRRIEKQAAGNLSGEGPMRQKRSVRGGQAD